MKKVIIRGISLVLVLCMMLTLLPVGVGTAMHGAQEDIEAIFVGEHLEYFQVVNEIDVSSSSNAIRYNVLVVDLSGSMGGAPIRALREASQRFVDIALNASGTNYIAIVAFSNSATLRADFTTDPVILRNAINGLNASGGTNMNAGLLMAEELLADISNTSAIRNVLLLSDGLPNAGATSTVGPFAHPQPDWRYANAVYHTAQRLMRNGHNVYALGFFHSMSGATLEFARHFKNLLQNRGYFDVVNPDDLENVFRDIADDIFQDNTTPPPVNTILAGLFSQSSSIYNHSLATFAAELSDHAYDRDIIRDNLVRLGLQYIRQYNYIDVPHSHVVAHSIAHRDIVVNGNEKTLIVVAIRGTQARLWQAEWRSNFTIGGNEVHTGFARATADLCANLTNYANEHGLLINPENNIVLMTGHSRGGAVANLQGANLNNRSEHLVTYENLYVYTFGTPNTSRNPVLFTNIFNIINRNDPIPLVPSPSALRPNEWRRYGRDLAVTMTRTPRGGFNIEHHHIMRTYLNWMNENPNLTFSEFFELSLRDRERGFLPRLVSIKCPVDVSVFDGQGRLVAEITNGIAREMANSNAFAFVANDVKQIFLPYGDTYTIRFRATDGGIMTYSVESIDILSDTPHAVKIFENVRLYLGREMVSEISNISDVRLQIVENGVVVGEIAEDGTERPVSSLPFTDVSSNNWFYPYVSHVFENGIMQGTTATTFAPSANFSRAMVVATLYRMVHGGTAREIPYARNRTVFSDIRVNAWYSPYVIWAYDNGIVEGIGNNRFAPSNNVTREQFATMMYRFAEFVRHDTAIRQGNQWNSFTDRNQISTWARDGLIWANYHGLINGRTTTTIVPNGTTTRAEASAILVRFMRTFGDSIAPPEAPPQAPSTPQPPQNSVTSASISLFNWSNRPPLVRRVDITNRQDLEFLGAILRNATTATSTDAILREVEIDFNDGTTLTFQFNNENYAWLGITETREGRMIHMPDGLMDFARRMLF